MTCAKILCTGLVAGLIVAAEAAATPAWRDSVDLPTSIGGSVQAQLRQGWLHAWRVDDEGQELWHTILGQADQPGRVEKTNPFTVVVHHPDGQSHIRDEMNRNRLSGHRQALVGEPFPGLEIEVGDPASPIHVPVCRGATPHTPDPLAARPLGLGRLWPLGRPATHRRPPRPHPDHSPAPNLGKTHG